MNVYLTLDIGGSAIKYALMQEDLTILEKSSIPTPLDSLESLVEAVGSLYDIYSSVIAGMPVSMPGVIDSSRGFQYTGGYLYFMENMDTVHVLKKRCPVNITIGNDAKCAANAEIGYGCLRDVQDAIVVILGTGIGGCLVKDHKIHEGRHFMAGEFSSMKTNVLYPFEDCYEWRTRCGIEGLLKRVQDTLGIDEKLTGIDIFNRANAGEQQIIDAIDLFAREIAVQLFNLTMIFDCERIAIGGGISAQPLLIEHIKENLNRIFDGIYLQVWRPEVMPCKFRNDANMVGALYQHLLSYPVT